MVACLLHRPVRRDRQLQSGLAVDPVVGVEGVDGVADPLQRQLVRDDQLQLQQPLLHHPRGGVGVAVVDDAERSEEGGVLLDQHGGRVELDVAGVAGQADLHEAPLAIAEVADALQPGRR